MFNKMIAAIICFLLIAAPGYFQPRAHAEDDIYYLENEIRETQAKHDPLAMDIYKMDAFLRSYDTTVNDLKSAHDELDKIEENVRRHLAGNLLKSSVLAIMDLYAAATLPVGLAKKTVMVIAAEVVKEVAGNYMQNRLSAGYYDRAVGSLSYDAQKLLPEIEELQKTLGLTIEEVQAIAKIKGEDLGESGAVYRKFALVLEQISKAKKAILALIASMNRKKAEIEITIGEIRPEADRLYERLKSLMERLEKAREEKRKAEIAELVEAAKKGIKQPTVPKVPAVTAKDWEEAFKQWYPIYEACANTLKERVPPIAPQIGPKRGECDKEYQEFLNNMVSRKIIELGWGNTPSPTYWLVMPEEKSPDGMTLTQMAESHLAAKTIMEFLKSASSDIKGGIGTLDRLKDKIVEIAALESQLLALQQYAQSVEGERQKIAPGSVDWQHDALRLFRELTYRDLDINTMNPFINKMNEVGALREMLADYDKRLPAMLEIYDKNAKGYEKAFPVLAKEYETKFAKLMESLTNASNALSQLEGTAAAYDKLVAGSGWFAKRNPGADQWYYSGATGGMAENLKYEFNEKSFVASLEEAVAKDNLNAADEVMKKFEKLVEDYKSLERKYSAAWTHYFYYCDEAELCTGMYINDMKEASQVKGAILKVTLPDIAKEQSLYDNTVKFGSVWRGLRTLPNIDLDLEKLTAYKFYELRKKISRESRAWLALKKEDFYKKTDEVYQELAKLTGEGMQPPAAADAVKRDVLKIIGDYQAAHGEVITAVVPEKPVESPKAPSIGLTDMKINGHTVGNISGDLVITKDELKGGSIELTAALSPIDAIESVLISEDGGATWIELPKAARISYSLAPIPKKHYKLVLKVKTTSKEEIAFNPYPNISSISYDDTDFNTLIVQAVTRLADAYESNNVSAFMALVSNDFLGNKWALENGVRYDFDTFDNIRLSLYINNIERRGNVYAVGIKWNKSQTAKKAGTEVQTTGNTTMVFVYEGGAMKLQNLRGDLIYATLSPEIAQASGLGQAVIDSINKVRKGGGVEVVPSGGAGTGLGTGTGGGGAMAPGGTLITGTFTLTQYKLPHPPDFDIEGYSFSSNSKMRETAPFPVVSDFRRREEWLESRGGLLDLGSAGIDSVTEAPASGYSGGVSPADGHVYAVQIPDGSYALVEIMSLSTDATLPNTSSFRYKHQRNGTRSFK